MPYPIPDNLDDIEGWRWYLVPLPDSDHMIRIAWGMWSELTNYWIWGEEGPVPDDSDKAAQLWSEALYEAWRVRDMGFPDDILTYIDEVEGLLREIKANNIVPICCDDIAQVDDDITSDIVPDLGDPPDTWGGDPVADWLDWRRSVCGAANGIVDEIKSKLALMKSYATIGFVTSAFVLTLFSAFASIGIIALSVTGLTVTSGFIALTAGLLTWDFDQIIADVEAARGEILCSIFESCANWETAIEDATGSSWAFFSLYNWCNVRNALLEGQYGTQDLSVDQSTACDSCGEVFAEVWNGTEYERTQARSFTFSSYTAEDGTETWDAARIRFMSEASANVLVNVVSLTTSVTIQHTGSGNAWNVYNASGTETYGADAKPSFPRDAWLIFMQNIDDISNPPPGYIGDGPFTVTIEWEPIP